MNDYLKDRFERAYPLREQNSQNFTNLKPFISLVMEFSEAYKEGEAEALTYINKIQQHLFNKKAIPFIVTEYKDIVNIEKLNCSDVKKLLWHIWLLYDKK